MNNTLLIVGDPRGNHSLAAFRKYPAESITVWEHPDNFYTIKQIDSKINVTTDLQELVDKGMKFDVVIGNPPYLKNIHLEFLKTALLISDNVSLIHPAGWLFRNGQKIEAEVKKLLKGRIKKLVLFNGNSTFKGAEFACPLVRTYAVKEYTGPIEIHSEITGNTYYINDLSEFPTGYWEPTDLHLEIINVMKNFSSEGNINSLVSVKSTRPFLGCPRVVGHGKTLDPNKYASNDFHIFHYKNSNVFNAKTGEKVFEVGNTEEVQSLKSYLETKFARFGLSISKISQDSYVYRYFENVPLPPLDRQWTEESVMEYYSMKPEHIEYINSFIPDYY